MADETLTALEFQRAGGTEDFRVLGTGAAAWYAAPSHLAGARLASRLAAVGTGDDATRPQVDLDVRAQGVRVRIPLTPEDDGFTQAHVDVARRTCAAAAELGLEPDPGVLQDVQLTLDVLDQAAVAPFWQEALGYDAVGDEDLMDPLRRRPPIWFQDMDAPRPLRNRIHLDSVRPQEQSRATVDAADDLGGSVADHGYYATVADAEGNEVDVLPLPAGADRWEDDATDDWRLVFSAMTGYPVASAAQGARLAETVAALADEAGLPLGIDLRHGVVVLDSGKDRWETTEGYDVLAARVQAAARDLGLRADVGLARFLQVGLDAADIPAVRSFWRTVLGYEDDPRDGVTDIVDPRGLGTVLFFQDVDADDRARRAQRNRLHLDLFLPDDQLPARLEAAVAAGGTVVRDVSPISWTVADPEGNEVDLTTSAGREEQWRAGHPG